MRNLLLLLLLVTIIPTTLFSQWESVSSGIPGYSATVLEFNGNEIIYGSNYEGLYCSTNNGVKWEFKGLDGKYISQLYANSSNVYAGGEGLYYSSNYGNSFSSLLHEYIRVFDIEKAGDALIAACGFDGLKISTNNGTTWQTQTFPFATASKILYHNNRLILGLDLGMKSGSGGLKYSTNMGTTWNSTNIDSLETDFLCNTSTSLFASDGRKLLRSSNNGGYWETLSPNFLDTGNYKISMISVIENDLYISTHNFNYFTGSLFKSTNQGNTWQELNFPGRYECISIKKINSVLVLSVNYRGIYLSYDNGLTWDHFLPPDANIEAFYTNGNRLFAGVQNEGVYYSDNNGESWKQSDLNNRSIGSFSSSGSYLFAGVIGTGNINAGIYYSTNNGLNWHYTNNRDRNTYAMTSLGNSIFAGTMYNGIQKSTNNWSGWSTSLLGLSIHSLKTFDNKIFAGAHNSGIYYSLDTGYTWIQSSLNNTSISGFASNSSYMYAASNNLPGMYRSSDGGINWSPLNFQHRLWDVINFNDHIIAASSNQGVLISSDNGNTWRTKNEGLNSYNIRAITKHNSYIFGGSLEHGIFRTEIDYLTSINPISHQSPTKYSLLQNYPNPFNPTTTINFEIPRNEFVKLTIFNVIGEEIVTIVNENLNAGTYSIDFNGSGLSSGIYFYKLSSGNFTQVKRMVLVK